MVDVRATATVHDGLRRLGFTSSQGEGGHTVFRHAPSDTVFLFHADGPRTLPPMRVASIRRLSVDRGAASERAFDQAMVAAAVAAEKRSYRRRSRQTKAE